MRLLRDLFAEWQETRKMHTDTGTRDMHTYTLLYSTDGHIFFHKHQHSCLSYESVQDIV